MPPRKRLGDVGLTLMDKAANRSARLFSNRQTRLWRLPIDVIRPDPDQPRHVFHDEDISSLASSIKERGLLTPICVSREENETYMIVFGERRWRACCQLEMEEIDCIVLDEAPNPEERRAMALVENIQRTDLAPLDLALACRELVEREGVPQERAAEMLGVSRVWLTRVLSVSTLPETIVARCRAAEQSLDLSALQEIAVASPKTMPRLLDMALSGATVLALRAARQTAPLKDDLAGGGTKRNKETKTSSPSLTRFLSGLNKRTQTLDAVLENPPTLNKEQKTALRAYRDRIDALLKRNP
jgi:ParB family transcriptional regulator, chromosome partitioning protein